MAGRKLPLHVFHFDCFWTKAFQWCDFEWDPLTFPDPEGMIRRLKAKGLKIAPLEGFHPETVKVKNMQWQIASRHTIDKAVYRRFVVVGGK